MIPRAEATGNLDVVDGARVLSLPVDEHGRAAGAVYTRGGRTFVQPAAAVVLCAHTFENTRLLLLSRSADFPDWAGNNAGQVGRNAMSHVYVGVDAVFPGLRLNRYGGTFPQCTSLDDFNADNFDHTGLGFVGGACLNAVTEAKPIATALSTPPSVPRWGSAWKAWLARNGNSVGRVIATAESLPYEDSFLDLDPSVVDPQGVPVVRVTYRLHAQEERRYDYLHARITELLLEAGAGETWSSYPRLPAAPFPERLRRDADVATIPARASSTGGASPTRCRTWRSSAPRASRLLGRLCPDGHDPGPRLAHGRPARRPLRLAHGVTAPGSSGLSRIRSSATPITPGSTQDAVW